MNKPVEDNKKLAVRATPNPKIQLNRKLIMGGALVVVSAVALAIMHALVDDARPKVKEVQEELPVEITPLDKDVKPLADLKDLPGNYSDVASIKRYMPTPAVQSSGDSERLALVMQQLSDLQYECASLKRQLAARPVNEPKIDDEKTLEAKRANLIFGNVSDEVENVFSRRRLMQNDQNKDLVATPEQEKQLRDKGDNQRHLDVARGDDMTRDIYDMHNIIKPVSKYLVQAGTLIPATLITGVNTTVVGTIVAQITSDIYDSVTGKYLLIPRGSKLIGEYDSRVTAGQRRVLMEFGRIVRPDGSSILLGRAIGSDAIGQSGVEGNVNNHWARIIGAATISTILTVGAGIGSDAIDDRTGRRAFIGGANALNNVGQNIVNRELNIRPTLTIAAGTYFHVTVKRDMTLTPYKRRTGK